MFQNVHKKKRTRISASPLCILMPKHSYVFLIVSSVTYFRLQNYYILSKRAIPKTDYFVFISVRHPPNSNLM